MKKNELTEIVFRKDYKSLIKVASNILGDWEIAKDVVQDAFLYILTSVDIDTINHVGQLKAILITVTRWISYKQAKRKRLWIQIIHKLQSETDQYYIQKLMSEYYPITREVVNNVKKLRPSQRKFIINHFFYGLLINESISVKRPYEHKERVLNQLRKGCVWSYARHIPHPEEEKTKRLMQLVDEGYSTKQIAELLNLSISKVHSRKRYHLVKQGRIK